MLQNTGVNPAQPSALSSGMAIGLSENEHMPSMPNMQLDPELVNQVYQAYVQLLGRDKNAKIKDVLSQEPFLSMVQ